MGGAAGVLVGRDAADRGEGAAAGLGGTGRVVVRSGIVDGVPGALQAGGQGDGAIGAQRRPADDRDGDVCAVDGAQAAVQVGVPVIGRGGVGLDSSAAVLSDRVVRAGAGRVDGPEVDAADRSRDGQRADARGDRGGDAVQAVSSAGRQDRFDGDRGGREVPDRREPGCRRGEGPRARGSQAREAGRGETSAGAGPVSVDGPQVAGQ